MLTGWGIFALVFAFSVGVIAGAGGLAAFALSTAIKGRATKAAASEELEEKIKKTQERLMDRVERIKTMRAAVDSIAKTSPLPIPELRALYCMSCGAEWKGRPNVVPFCPSCESGDCVDASLMRKMAPFIGEPS